MVTVWWFDPTGSGSIVVLGLRGFHGFEFKMSGSGLTANEEEEEPLHQKIQSIVHRIGNSLMPWKVNHALSAAEIKTRMAGIPVYRVATYSDGDAGIFALDDPERRLKLHFFSKPDALDFFDKMKLMGHFPAHDHCRIFDAPLSHVVVADAEGKEDPIRLVPESSQIKNAFEEKKKNMIGSDYNFISGVPVFKCDALRMGIISRGNTGDFCPVYLRKEDLQDTITALDILPCNIEVASLEEIIQEMKDSSTNKSNDIVFVGPGNSTSWL